MFTIAPPPLVNSMPLRSALIIDNSLDEVQELATDLSDKGMSVVVANGTSMAREMLKNRPEIGLIIIDWYLDEENPDDAMVFLADLKHLCFAPIVVYTKQSDFMVKEFLKEKGLEGVATVLKKTQVTGAAVLDVFAKWLANNAELRIYLAWSFEVESRLNNSLWGLYDMDQRWLSHVLEAAEKGDDVSRIPEEQIVVDLLTKSLSRRIGADDEFRGKVKNLLTGLRTAPISPPVDNVKRTMDVFEYEMYIRPPISNPIWTGDILRKPSGRMFVILTPICDLCHAGKADRVLLARAIPFNEYRSTVLGQNEDRARTCIEHRKLSVHYLPYFMGASDGLVCLFDELHTRSLAKLIDDIRKGKLTRAATIDSPFIEHLLQRMTSYVARLGTRDLSKEEVQAILDATKPQDKTSS